MESVNLRSIMLNQFYMIFTLLFAMQSAFADQGSLCQKELLPAPEILFELGQEDFLGAADPIPLLKAVRNGVTLSSASYIVHRNNIDIIYMYSAYPGQKYNLAVVSEILRLHPETALIRATLMETNFAVFQSHIRSGKSVSQSIIETPLYRTLNRLGFKHFVVPDKAPSSQRHVHVLFGRNPFNY